MSISIKRFLKSKGYQYLDKGVYQEAYLAPDGTVLKIYKPDERNKFSKAQMSFIDFAKFCQKNPNNPFLPYFFGWETFKWGGNLYLQIKSERLFPINKIDGQLISSLVSPILDGIKPENIKYIDDIGYLIDLLGGLEKSRLFYRTVRKINDIARVKGYRLDLHYNNFMYGSDGQLVINDPFAF